MNRKTLAALPLLIGGFTMSAIAQQEEKMKEIQEDLEDLQKELKSLKAQVGEVKPGTTKFLITGYSFAGFSDAEGSNSSFNAGFVPIFLWKLSDRAFFEGELEFELEDDETEVNLEYAHLTYLLNDYMTFGAGRFLNPSSYFFERLHAAWINKLPDFPLVFREEGGIQAVSQLGAQLRGGIPLGDDSKLGYAVYLANGTGLNTETLEEAGTLDFKNFEDNNNGKAIGGRIGFFPIPELEMGYAIEGGRAGESGTSFRSVDVLTQSVDLNVRYDSDAFMGSFDCRAQWVWSEVDRATYDPTGALGFGPIDFLNNRNGGYAQVAYRPSQSKDPLLQKLEGVVRYDALNVSTGVPSGFDESRWTVGLNCWCTSSTVLKLAYQFDHKSDPTGAAQDADAFLVQFAIGF